jgi:type I restriction enzyme S subunit
MMNKIQQFIAEHCPNGVEFKKLGEVCEIYTGTQFNKRDMEIVGDYPVINGGIEASGYSDKFNENENTITISQGGASAGFVNWLKTKFWAGAHCYIIRPTNNDLDNRYLYFFLKDKQTQIMELKHGAGIPGLNSEKIKKLSIPLPPLLFQHEIVAILDKFTELEVELEVELKAELEARKKQYEYYRCKLLTFNEMRGGG